MVKYLDNNKSSGFSQWMANQNKKPDSGKKGFKLSNFLWWMVIFLAAWWAFTAWFGPDKKESVVSTQESGVIEDLSRVPTSKIDSDKITADVQGLRVSKIELKDYKQDKKENADKNIALLGASGDFAEVGLIASGTTAPTSSTVWNAKKDSYSWRNGDGVEFTRTVVVDDYIISIKDTVRNAGKKDVSFVPYARIVRDGGAAATAVETGAVSFANSDIEYNNWKQLDKKSYAYTTVNGFAGFADQYWETVVSMALPDQTIRTKKIDARYQADITAAPVHVAAGQTAVFETKMFAGPRDQAILKDAAASINGINQTIDYGWFWFLSRPMLWALNAINGFVMNYGLAIILLTIGLRILMWPLTRKSYTSMAAMQKMQPEMARIQKLYANDKARQQMEMMKLYQTHKTSPMSGCLPMLLQIPIFFALYKALLISVPMRCAGFLWISDLSLMDPYFILPLIMGATMWWQQKLQSAAPSANANDPMAQTQKIMKWMPVMFTVLFAWMPAGLVLYWTVSNLFGIGQMYVIKKTSK